MICQGLVYRYRVFNYLSPIGIYSRSERITPLKKMSCGRCPECKTLIQLLEGSKAVSFPAARNDRDMFRLVRNSAVPDVVYFVVHHKE